MSGNYIGNEPGAGGVILVGDTNPVGLIVWTHAPPDATYLSLNGQLVTKAAYPDLWQFAQGFLTADQIANPGLYRNVDAASFAVPNLSGLFVRGSGQVDVDHAAAALGAKQADGFAQHTHQTLVGPGGSVYTSGGPNLNGAYNTQTGGSGTASSETRPVNVALVPSVKAKRTVMAVSTTAITPATAADQIAASAPDKFVTPAVQQAHPSAAKAFVYFNGTGTVAIRGSYNVSSITDNGVGDYTVNFQAPFPNLNYTLAFAGGLNGTSQGFLLYEDARTAARTASSVRLQTASTTAQGDCPLAQVTAFSNG